MEREIEKEKNRSREKGNSSSHIKYTTENKNSARSSRCNQSLFGAGCKGRRRKRGRRLEKQIFRSVSLWYICFCSSTHALHVHCKDWPSCCFLFPLFFLLKHLIQYSSKLSRAAAAANEKSANRAGEEEEKKAKIKSVFSFSPLILLALRDRTPLYLVQFVLLAPFEISLTQKGVKSAGERKTATEKVTGNYCRDYNYSVTLAGSDSQTGRRQ